MLLFFGLAVFLVFIDFLSGEKTDANYSKTLTTVNSFKENSFLSDSNLSQSTFKSNVIKKQKDVALSSFDTPSSQKENDTIEITIKSLQYKQKINQFILKAYENIWNSCMNTKALEEEERIEILCDLIEIIIRLIIIEFKLKEKLENLQKRQER